MAKEYVKQAVSSDGTRTISAQRGFSWQRFLFQWEWMLVLMLTPPSTQAAITFISYPVQVSP